MTITLTMESSFNTALLGGVVVLIVIVVIVVYALKFVGKRDRRGRGRYPGGRDGGSL